MSSEVKIMEIKKTRRTAEESVLTTKKVQKFVADMTSEVQKVEWTNKNELLTYTKIVVAATLVFGMCIYAMDLLIQGALGALNFLLRFIVG